MNMKRNVLIVLLFLLSVQGWAQESAHYNATAKGHAYISWGWNRGFFTKSRMVFKGTDYDFTLYKVKAHDRPTLPINFHDYLNPHNMTTPQTNFRAGYFIKDNLAVTLADDHMKYVMDRNQVVKMKGTITRPGVHQGTYNGDKLLSPDFLQFEHTNGLNYLNAEIEKYFSWLQKKNDRASLKGMLGGGAGILYPRTDAKLMDYPEDDRFHVSGFGLTAKAGVEYVFLKHLFLKLEDKLGYINMPDIILHEKGNPGRARQAFFFTETTFMFGGIFNVAGKKKRKK